MVKEEKDRLTSTIKILKQLDRPSLIIIESSANALKARQDMEEELGKEVVQVERKKEKAKKPTLNDIRREHGLEKISGGDVVLTKVQCDSSKEQGYLNH